VADTHALHQARQIRLHGLAFNLEMHQLGHLVLGQQLPHSGHELLGGCGSLLDIQRLIQNIDARPVAGIGRRTASPLTRVTSLCW
jgi:hypothetical protein